MREEIQRLGVNQGIALRICLFILDELINSNWDYVLWRILFVNDIILIDETSREVKKAV